MSTVNVITLKCPACGKRLNVKSEMAGRRLACPEQGCGAAIDVPGPANMPGLELRTRLMTRLMTVVGLVFTVIAAMLTIRELHLDAGWIISTTLVAVVVLSEFLKGSAKSGMLVVFTLVGLSTPAIFFIIERKLDPDQYQRELAIYVGAMLFFGLSSYLAFRTYSTWSRFNLGNSTHAQIAINLESCVVWFALIISSIACSWVNYYKFLSPLGEEEFLARRLLFTLFFVVVGVICSVFGRNSLLPFLGVTGLIYMAAGVVKALAYDLFKTEGIVRIGVFAGCGAVLLLGGFLMTKAPRRKVVAASDSPFIDD
jgi:hypothetical protein